MMKKNCVDTANSDVIHGEYDVTFYDALILPTNIKQICYVNYIHILKTGITISNTHACTHSVYVKLI